MDNSQMTPDTPGWLCFNTSNEQWEWSTDKHQKCEGATKIRACTWGEFCKEFPDHEE